MKKFRFTRRFGKVAGVLSVSCCALAAMAGSAMAVPILDLTSAATAVTAELTPAITSALPIAGTIIAVGVGWKMFKRFVK